MNHRHVIIPAIVLVLGGLSACTPQQIARIVDQVTTPAAPIESITFTDTSPACWLGTGYVRTTGQLPCPPSPGSLVICRSRRASAAACTALPPVTRSWSAFAP